MIVWVEVPITVLNSAGEELDPPSVVMWAVWVAEAP
jgi:hypothetical protein